MFDKLKGRLESHDGLNSQASTSRTSRDSSHRDQQAPPSYSDSTHVAPPTEKAVPHSAPPFTSNFACVSLHMSDKIRLLQLPLEQRDALRTSILQSWPRGIQREREYYGSHEFKFHGNPWTPWGDNALHARRLTRGILSTLHSAGWLLYVATDVSRNPGDKDSLFFRHQSPPPAPREWFSVTFSKGDRIRLIDAPREVIEDVVAALAKETQRHEPYRVPGVYEIKIEGYPFAASGGATMTSRRLCLTLFEVFERHGLTLAASMDQKYNENDTETDTWHLSRPIGWEPGAPVYHE